LKSGLNAFTSTVCDNGCVAVKRRKRPRDPLQLAKLIGDIATGQLQDLLGKPLDPTLVETRRKAGTKGASSRAGRLSPEQRSEIARVAALARWKKS
jgi:hypothetical protein